MAIIPKRDNLDRPHPEGVLSVTLTNRTYQILAHLCKDLGEPYDEPREKARARNYVVNKLLELAENDREYKENRARESDAPVGKTRRVRTVAEVSESAA